MKLIPPSKLKESNSLDNSDKEGSSDQSAPNAVEARNVPKVKRKYTVVSNGQRIQIIIAISEFGLNCL